MCDTFIADRSSTGAGYKIFGKNSDREPNEAQAIVRMPRRSPEEKELRVSYITIPQVAETYEVILSKPFQMWGAEMGVNEHGVVIGNEAVFTNVKFDKKNTGLTGMDMLRLALERSMSAEQAVKCITELLETYGQDACGGYKDKGFYYHNSFIIADTTRQFILETAGRHWVAREVQGYGAISNGLTISNNYDSCSNTVKQLEKNGKKIDFAATYRDKVMSYFARCDYRQAHSIERGAAIPSRGVAEAFRVLRSHGEADLFQPHASNMKALCIHASGLFTPHQTTGSMVVQLRKDAPPTVWLTGTSAPCISLYTPFYFGGNTLAGNGPHLPSGEQDASLWWQGEVLHRLALTDYKEVSAIVNEEFKQLQISLIDKDSELITSGADATSLDAFSATALAQHLQLLEACIQKVSSRVHGTYRGSWWYRRFRKRLDRSAGINSMVWKK